MKEAAYQFPEEVRDEADDLAVAVGRLRVGEAAQRRRRVEARALRLHLGRLAPLRLRELRRDHNQAQVDHEERADLGRGVEFRHSSKELTYLVG